MITKKALDLLIELSKQDFKCPYERSCCEFGAYNQCYNHAHVLCIEFEKRRVSDIDSRKYKSL